MDAQHTAVTLLPLLVVFAAGCNLVGPAALSSGRSSYNEVINATEDEQILSIIVRKRYEETFGMLAVSSVTASLRISGSIGADFGVGPSSSYEGNLVPLSAGAAYEENPTISYVPVRGEQFVERMLAPISAEQVLLLSRMSTPQVEVMRLLVRRANGLANPLYSSVPANGDFDRFVDLYTQLREAGRLDIVGTGDGRFEMLLGDTDGTAQVAELLELLGVSRPDRRGPVIAVPVQFFVGAPDPGKLDLETPSALEVLDAAASGVEVPDRHLADGVAPPQSPGAAVIDIRSSRDRPRDATVAVRHQGWWFSIDARDTRSKQAFMILRTLVGLRMDQVPPGQQVPVLTVPVAR